MVRFFSRPAVPLPQDLCLVHSPPPGPALVRPGSLGWWCRRDELPLGTDPGTFLGEADGAPLWAVEAPADEGWTPLRTVMAEATPDQAAAAVRAATLAAWAVEARFCGRCGSPTRRQDDQTMVRCPSCGLEIWPKVVPAVIMLVHRGDEALLACHTRHSRPGVAPVFTTLAGFVEAGETLEQTVRREAFEEVGVTVGEPRYLGSQPWPFPYSLMVGFHVPWVSGEPVPDGDEIAEAGWFRRDNLPAIPGPPTIARRLIEAFFDRSNP